MRYLVTTTQHPPFFTFYFDPENHFDSNESGMVVFDLMLCKYTTDGVTWIEIETDQL